MIFEARSAKKYGLHHPPEVLDDCVKNLNMCYSVGIDGITKGNAPAEPREDHAGTADTGTADTGAAGSPAAADLKLEQCDDHAGTAGTTDVAAAAATPDAAAVVQ